VYGADNRPTLGGHRLERREDVESHVRVESRRRLVKEQQARVRQHLTHQNSSITNVFIHAGSRFLQGGRKNWHNFLYAVTLSNINRFLPRDALLSAVYAVVVCLCVCLSVCLCVCVSVTFRYSIKTANVGSRKQRRTIAP